jgi:single-stranded-DNA-specific exonuclease
MLAFLNRIMEYKIIKQRHRNYYNEAFITAIQRQFGLSELSAAYLASKGFSTLGQIEEYLHPKPQDFSDPYLFADMEKCVGRIEKAIREKEKIAIYGDYDCDGVCATVILYKALQALHADVFYYLPDRFSDGYGFSMQAIDTIRLKGASLIISVDNGITAAAEIRYAKEAGIDTIVSDHHNCPDVLPEAFAVINPKNTNEKYPYEYLCGAAVAYKIAQALGADEGDLGKEMLTFAAVATVADLVPLTQENRSIVSIGLSLIKERINIGLTKLIEVSELKIETIAAGHISFSIAPRINACGRLYKADTAVELFLETDASRALSLANELNAYNDERRLIEADITLQAEQYISNHNLAENGVLLIKLEDANEGVIGVACGRLCEKYNRPTIICVSKNGICKGSARSIPKINIYERLCLAKDLFIKFGGHAQAAGFTIREADFERMRALITLRTMTIRRMH